MKRNPLPRRLAIPGIVLAATGALLGSSALPGREHAPRAMNILLMGTDERNTISDAEKHEFHAGGHPCGCSDVLMLVHLSAHRDRVSVISMPRDSHAEIPPYRYEPNGKERPPHPAKINAAYQEGGPDLAMQTVESMTGVRIDRFLEVDFRRFMDTVDTVGGVEVCTPRPLKDSATKLDLEPGKHRLGGGQALQYVRSRHVDSSADLGRIQRQQRFLVQALRRVQGGLLADPARTADMVHTLLGSGPQSFSVTELVDLAASLRKLPASATEFVTVPIAGFTPANLGIGAALDWDREKSDALFAKVRKDRPLVAKGPQTKPKDPPTVLGSTVPVRGSAYACG
ncbi:MULTISPECIES: LCP family protein [unclassified Streptomyces]|uniref:LCP family protein n=1 Tax=unclassified Streptomyces TaxID=2593676 RepID=UPI002E81D603|nr:LCP family protein [Streptomyces sp. NBC_00589]WTI42767.1 LCP family protein [Streptomyces sp. NBC_00775]WUB33017.1 LCP family protein [Streptomyces sp. NBC_00589]